MMASSATALGASSSADTRQSRFEQSVALSLALWPALSLAVQNNWGGPDSADKRDWLAGQVVEQFPPFTSTTSSSSQPPSSSTTTTTTTTTTKTTTSAKQQQQQKSTNKTGGGQQQEEATDEPDAEYIEALLLQVLLDEFEVNVDDESAFDVAAEILRLRGQCAKGQFADVDRLLARWEARKGAKVVFTQGQDQDQDDDTDWDDTDGEEEDEDEDGDGDGDGDGDEEMGEAPPLVTAKEKKPVPEVDEDGFTKVTRKR